MTDSPQAYRPGQIVPVSGIYRCDAPCGHTFESTDVKGHRFPPLTDGCSGSGWLLERAAAHR